jgi:hypothetical protein
LEDALVTGDVERPAAGVVSERRISAVLEEEADAGEVASAGGDMQGVSPSELQVLTSPPWARMTGSSSGQPFW